MKKRILEYSITFGVASLLAFIIAILSGVFKYKEAFRIYAAICDGLFISGILVLAVGGLLFIHNCGFFDIFAYGFMRFIALFKRNPRENKYETFYDFSVARAEKPKVEFGYFLIIGLGFILISLVFFLLWGKASGEF